MNKEILLIAACVALVVVVAMIIEKTPAYFAGLFAIGLAYIGQSLWRAEKISFLMPLPVTLLVVLVWIVLVWLLNMEATAKVIYLIVIVIMIIVVIISMTRGNGAIPEKNVPSATFSQTSVKTSSEEKIGRKILEEARKYEGNPYILGGNSLTEGIDCSHFVRRVYINVGLIEDGVKYYATANMWYDMKEFLEEWNLEKLPSTDLENAIDGDILLYSHSKDGSEVHHVGMYIKDGGLLAEAKGRNYGITMSYDAYKEPKDYIIAIFRSKKGSESIDNESKVPVSASTSTDTTATGSEQSLVSRLIAHLEETTTEETHKVVCLDAGHGGAGISEMEDNDPDGTSKKTAQSTGTESANGLLEKDVNLAVALATGKLLEEAGIKVVYTRTTDEAVSNIRRAEIAKEASADIFVRIHCDGDENISRRGCYCYCISENNKWQASNYQQSKKLCQSILSAFSVKTGMPVDKSFKDGILEDDGLTSNNWADMPTALIEMGNMRNAEDEEIQKNSAELMALGIAEGILQYLQ